MGIAATSARKFDRSAPDGSRVQVSVPGNVGDIQWFGTTRFSGPNFMRDFSFAPVGQYKVIPTRIMPGASQQSFRRRGYDLILFEAADRSDSCLVWVGPHNEVTTWFGGPAPREEVLNRIISAVRFTDSESGARIVAEPAANLQQHSTMLVGRAEQVLLMLRDAKPFKHTVPTWQGMQQGDVEVWRTERAVEGPQMEQLRGTAFEWRYLAASPTAMWDVVFEPRSENAQLAAADVDSFATSVLADTRVSWAK